ncbi:hypothetical protein GLYMA_13G255001v4 [Glycine max]|nr:hypothetical protein GLYMA_13G255001v4 [Glycine max]
MFFALTYGFGFATIASTLTHVVCFYGSSKKVRGGWIMQRNIRHLKRMHKEILINFKHWRSPKLPRIMLKLPTSSLLVHIQWEKGKGHYSLVVFVSKISYFRQLFFLRVH